MEVEVITLTTMKQSGGEESGLYESCWNIGMDPATQNKDHNHDHNYSTSTSVDLNVDLNINESSNRDLSILTGDKYQYDQDHDSINVAKDTNSDNSNNSYIGDVDIPTYTRNREGLKGPRNKVHTVRRLQGISGKGWSYSGIYYSNSFRVNEGINLVSVGFYGPWEHRDCVYSVGMEIREHGPNGDAGYGGRPLYFVKGRKVSAERRELFYLDLEDPLQIMGGKWYNICFQLDGPPTCKGERHLLTAKIGRTKFDFYSGSGQMPLLKFTL